MGKLVLAAKVTHVPSLMLSEVAGSPLKSAPEQKSLPAPESRIRRSEPCTAFFNSAISSGLRALRFSGRFRVIRAMPCSIW